MGSRQLKQLLQAPYFLIKHRLTDAWTRLMLFVVIAFLEKGFVKHLQHVHDLEQNVAIVTDKEQHRVGKSFKAITANDCV